VGYSLTLNPTISQQASSSAEPSATPSELHIDAADVVVIPGNDRKGRQGKVNMGLAKTSADGAHSHVVAVKESTEKDPAVGKESFKRVRTSY
jgi:hypothetical protein